MFINAIIKSLLNDLGRFIAISVKKKVKLFPTRDYLINITYGFS